MSGDPLEHEHLRNHLTDGWWHDDCKFCLRRRRYGGTGLEGQLDISAVTGE